MKKGRNKMNNKQKTFITIVVLFVVMAIVGAGSRNLIMMSVGSAGFVAMMLGGLWTL
jgi:hypothetical protein